MAPEGSNNVLFISSSQNLPLPKLDLDGSNWVLYKARIVSAITYRKLIWYLDGHTKQSHAPSANATDVKENYENDLDTWQAGNEHVHSIILSTLPETYQIEVISIPTAADVWKNIFEKFDDQSEMVQIDILHQMNQTHCAEDADPRKTIQILQTLRAKYASVGGKLEPAQFTAIILSFMPDCYQLLLHALIASTCINKVALTPNDLISHITEAAKHDFAQEQTKKDDATLAARTVGK
jgi:hypothetical protein